MHEGHLCNDDRDGNDGVGKEKHDAITDVQGGRIALERAKRQRSREDQERGGDGIRRGQTG